MTQIDNKKAGLTIPCHWDKQVIEKIVSQQGDLKVTEVYGALSEGGPVGHGRSKDSVKNVSKDEAVVFREWLAAMGLDFTYLLNAPFKFTDEKQKEDVKDYIRWVTGELKPNAVTVTSLELMELVRQMDAGIDIHISTIASVRNDRDLEKFQAVKPNRVVPHHDCGKRWEYLKGITDFGKKNGIETELLATESCIFQCPIRDVHYVYLSEQSGDEKFHTNCNSRKILNPREFLLAGGTIRPEDLGFYEGMGVNYFKITGRSKPATWLPEVTKAYIERKYEGNLIRLLGIDPSLKAEEWIYIDNKSLDGFIEGFPQTGIREDENRYADEWMIKLYENNEFKLLDGTKYITENNELKLKEIGDRSERIIENEFKIRMR